mgnify:CR=1 FL=1
MQSVIARQGEDTEAKANGLKFMADSITELGKQSVSATDDAEKAESARIAFDILGLVKKLDFHAGRTFIADIFIGSKSKRMEGLGIKQNPKDIW